MYISTLTTTNYQLSYERWPYQREPYRRPLTERELEEIAQAKRAASRKIRRGALEVTMARLDPLPPRLPAAPRRRTEARPREGRTANKFRCYLNL
jgi:hypothetical protein